MDHFLGIGNSSEHQRRPSAEQLAALSGYVAIAGRSLSRLSRFAEIITNPTTNFDQQAAASSQQVYDEPARTEPQATHSETLTFIEEARRRVDQAADMDIARQQQMLDTLNGKNRGDYDLGA